MKKLALLLLVACTKPAETPKAPVAVAAASDLMEAFKELGQQFETKTPFKVELSFGSSGLLAKQLAQGGPYDVFASASEAFVDDAVKAGACDGATKRVYAVGQLAIWGKVLPDKVEDLSDSHFRHIALANPEHAPYGQAARETLVAYGLWDSLKDRIVLAENVRAALQMAETGNADAAFISASLLKDKKVLAIDPSKHQPLTQALVLCKKGPNAAGGKAFAELVTSAEGRAVLAKHGLSAPP